MMFSSEKKKKVFLSEFTIPFRKYFRSKFLRQKVVLNICPTLFFILFSLIEEEKSKKVYNKKYVKDKE